MSADESSSYAPKSPDLSALFSAAAPTNQPPAPPPFSLSAYGHQHQPRSFEPTPLYAQPHYPEQPTRPPVTAELHHLPHATAVPVGAPPQQQALHLQTQMPPRRAAAAAAVIEEPVIEPSPVRTKFPTARIKRIMQADEEVGKVAQQTPIAVGKALELFMVQLVSTSADIAKDKGSKRVTASMLKQVVERDDQWDFLREIVGKVENEKEGKPKQTKGESESDEDAYEPKKKGRGGRKKKGSV
ncbi:unnamed protein product [Clonostachys byssicola]|uniref:NCT transcriptional regulatory complex subunit A n=1 Tax=Clonostachys byssicola TaxID=160290 RepID=A0A9N9UEH0_9HYPO|nr:unnamed protein product [Clonostachys byssicola]